MPIYGHTEITHVFEEKSGFNDDRPEFAKLKELTKDDIDIVLVWELSRLSRRSLCLQRQIEYFTKKIYAFMPRKRNLRTLDEKERKTKTQIHHWHNRHDLPEEVATLKSKHITQRNKIINEGTATHTKLPMAMITAQKRKAKHK